ncbi:protein phosphatase 2C domain-containing protein [Neobacillus piezotolerans]|uniref:Protein phosphatase 2C domain-containing protein n=1 Tax=Neobacillus piezotolerans TaxID=2259171 RepID=A0A3D8GMV2_9BACI|nr:protein phosphatase 2C domain-containing protein [Neobacillus piezotolerans]RDU35637.1 protein phosphatase 2C domain-containing protein [Neobacillus piezotolerans]
MSREISWVGSEKDFVDEISVETVGAIVLGRFGGNSSAGQYKNEDGCIVWADGANGYEFVVLLDAHNSADSAELVVSEFGKRKEELKEILRLPLNRSLSELEKGILYLFQNEDFKRRCRKLRGETACLIAVRKENFLWWFSIGDCILYLHHPELAALQEYQQNHRSFYEWVGKVNTFELPVPCYSTGCKELRKGDNHILLTTDGLVECPGSVFDQPEKVFTAFRDAGNEEGVRKLLRTVQEKNVRDSTTILSWQIINETAASEPSDLVGRKDG